MQQHYRCSKETSIVATASYQSNSPIITEFQEHNVFQSPLQCILSMGKSRPSSTGVTRNSHFGVIGIGIVCIKCNFQKRCEFSIIHYYLPVATVWNSELHRPEKGDGGVPNYPQPPTTDRRRQRAARWKRQNKRKMALTTVKKVMFR